MALVYVNDMVITRSENAMILVLKEVTKVAMLEIPDCSTVFWVDYDRKMETVTNYRVLIEWVVTLLKKSRSDVCLHSSYGIEIYDIRLALNRW